MNNEVGIPLVMARKTARIPLLNKSQHKDVLDYKEIINVTKCNILIKRIIRILETKRFFMLIFWLKITSTAAGMPLESRIKG